MIKNYGGRKEILATVKGISSVQVQVSDAGVVPNERGRKIVWAGTIIGGIGASVLATGTALVGRHGPASYQTSFEGDNNDILFVSKTATSIAITQGSGASVALSAAVATNAVTVTLPTDTDSNPIPTTANDVIAIIASTTATDNAISATLAPGDDGTGFVSTLAASTLVSNTDVTNAEGVLWNDVDVTDGPAPGAMIIAGNINARHLPIAPTSAEISSLPRISFMNYQN